MGFIGFIIRLPFYGVGLFVWLIVGSIISAINVLTWPVFVIAMVLIPSMFPNKTKDIFTFGVLRRGIANLNRFLWGGL